MQGRLASSSDVSQHQDADAPSSAIGAADNQTLDALQLEHLDWLKINLTRQRRTWSPEEGIPFGVCVHCSIFLLGTPQPQGLSLTESGNSATVAGVTKHGFSIQRISTVARLISLPVSSWSP